MESIKFFTSRRALQIYCFLLLLVICQAAFAADTPEIDQAYKEAAKCYHQVGGLAASGQSTAKWHKCITLFNDFSNKYSKSDLAPKAIYSAGLSFRQLYEVSKNEDDARAAVGKFNELVRMYPKSNLTDDALFNIGTLKWEALGDAEGARKAMLRIIQWYPEGDMAKNAGSYLTDAGGDTGAAAWVRRPRAASKYVKLTKVEKVSDKAGERVMLSLSGPVSFRESHGPYDLPNFEVYTLELSDTYLSRMLDGGYSYVGKDIVRDVQISQVSRAKAEVNFIIKDGNYCTTHPKKASLEVNCRAGKWGSATATPVAAGVPKKTAVEKPAVSKEEAPEALPRKKLSIVIDAGHGGTDFGAVGKGGKKEKDIALQIAKRLGWQLRNKLDADVNYTRIEDRTLSLDDRSAVANGFEPDLFISIHTNAAPSSSLDGYQTFYLNNATDDAARKLAAFENASLGKHIDDVEKIILTMLQNINTDESRILAGSIHKNVLSKMSIYGLKDRRVGSGLFYVLARVKSPGVLIETSFISNPDEEQKLASPEYQENVAKAIRDGIKDYLAKTNSL